MPATDQDVQAVLAAFGASFKKTKGPLNAAARVDLLAGLALLHAHHLNLAPILAALSTAQ